MKITLPASRFHLNSDPQTCTIKGGEVFSADGLSGGALPHQSPLRASSDKNVYVVIGSDGFPVKEHREYKKYEAHKPYQAAIKAYYGLLRSKRPVTSTEPSPQEIQRILDVVSRVLTPAETAAYANKLRSAKLEMPALINLRRIDDSKVKSYVCFYELIDKPNKHEISKGIVKVAKAEEVNKYKVKRNVTDKDPVSLLIY